MKDFSGEPAFVTLSGFDHHDPIAKLLECGGSRYACHPTAADDDVHIRLLEHRRPLRSSG